ncbi:MAG: FAD-dependent oxidoreductase [Candidatus Eremiobacteraeota bacterium]|nr:FAD-dependent oxidoreductase [Candidatus Eremiobacteraeota bacterium]MBC5804826.1 FAD-dependent oxidoreductase [Candidatus Eremiobacteraeota bacterium]MBC5824609.1 FAD-dependent oxidoreductase [Candidatus Eremiobacteraeota bacterium]
MAFEFQKPPDWTFTAGQFIDITLQNPAQTDSEGNTRGFSISSAPYEETIMVTTRMRDTAFKRDLKSMPLENEVKIEGPFGDLTLDKDASRSAVFLTGGIGITTFRSIVFQAAHLKLPHRVLLFYSNRRPEDAAFLSELQGLQKTNPNYTLIATMTDMKDSRESWAGETGLIDAAMLGKYAEDTKNGIFYITGPPGMVKALHAMLRSTGLDDQDIRVEEYTGY